MGARDLAVPPSSRRKSGQGDASGERPRPSPALEARYRSLLVVGKGGMGTVEAALDVSHGDRIVALKRLLPDSARDARRVEMFLREAKLATMLDHGNVVRAYDYGEIEGELFFAMEYVEGQPLSRVLKTLAKPLPPSLAAHVLAEVCEGLHAAHELRGEDGQPLNLVHRDVSPQNVMLAHDGHVRLLDFGVAKIEAESVTKTGEVKGKTAYMSPEQAMGEAIDRRSDLFGVGAVLYECLTSKRMWGDGTDMEVIRKLALEEPPALEDAPAPLRALYEKLVARDPKARPATAREVAEALRAACPEGREEAGRALAALLEERFGDALAEQRARLEHALDDAVAPEKARELRESMSPGSLRDAGETSSVRRSDPGAGAVAAPEGGPPWGRYGVLAAAAVIVGVAAWRMSAAGGGDVGPSPSASHTSPYPNPSSAPTGPTASGESPAIVPSGSSPAPSASASGSHTAPYVSAPARSAGAHVVAQPTAKPAASASVAPTTSAPRPPPAHSSAGPIDENPL